MDFKNYSLVNNSVVVKKIKNFIPAHIFENGQCFRWMKTLNNSYIVVAKNRVIEVELRDEDLVIHNSNIDDFENIWIDYFDLERSYENLKRDLMIDEHLINAINFGNGLRMLNQDPFEIILSFIISSNNRIPMIKKAINNISKKFGQCTLYKGDEYYYFPRIDDLVSVTQEEFRDCSVGFRDKYLVGTIKMINDNNNLDEIKNLLDDDCHKELQKFPGVGSKVSDCIMLFSMKKYSAFPVDVWVKRAMMKFYVAPDTSLKEIRNFGRDLFKNLSGFAQQYLFYYIRENKSVMNMV